MTIRCVICIFKSSGSHYIEVNANNLHQIALVMPGTVVSYKIQEIFELVEPKAVNDADLFAQLDGTIFETIAVDRLIFSNK